MVDVSVKIKKMPIDADTYLGVEYIESTGTQYLQIGTEIDYNVTNLYIDYQYTDVTATSDYSSGGVYSISSISNYYDRLWAIFTTSGYGEYGYYYGSGTAKTLPENATLKRCVLDRNSNGLFFNGKEHILYNLYKPVGNYTNQITLFAITQGDKVSHQSKLRIYAFKLGNSDGYKYNLVPCVRKSDNVAGMYDTINKKFYTNNGTGEFLAGQPTGQLYFDETLIINKHNGLKVIESISESSGQQNDIFYGCIANSGSSNIVDINGDILKMLESGAIPNSNMPVEILVNGSVIQRHITNDSDYNINSKTFKMSMTNGIANWDNIVYRGKPLINKEQSAYDIVLEIMTSLGYSKEQIDDVMLASSLVYGGSNSTGTVKEYLQLIKIPYPYLASGTYRQTIDKICQVAQLQVYADNYGIPIFVSARPVLSDNMILNAIHIPKSYMESNIEKTVILKNKYDTIDMDEMVVSRVPVYDADCGSASSSDTAYETETSTATIGVEKGGKQYVMTLKLYFKPFVLTIPAKTNLNLNNTYNVKRFSSIANVGGGLLVENITNYSYFVQDTQETITISPETLNVAQFSQEKINKVEYNEADDTFTIYFVACVGRDASTKIDVYGVDDEILENQNYRAESITFNFFGEQLQVKFENQDVSVAKGDTTSTVVNLSTNELLQSGTTLENVKISTQIQRNIFSDYAKGVSNGTIKLFCGDLYTSSGELAKDWLSGDILNVHDVIYFDNDTYADNSQRYWRIVGRTFMKSGVPRLDLELQECVYNH